MPAEREAGTAPSGRIHPRRGGRERELRVDVISGGIKPASEPRTRGCGAEQAGGVPGDTKPGEGSEGRGSHRQVEGKRVFGLSVLRPEDANFELEAALHEPGHLSRRVGLGGIRKPPCQVDDALQRMEATRAASVYAHRSDSVAADHE